VSDKILFYSVGDEYGVFSNFAPYPISLDGKRWPTSEHYFQAQKLADPKLRERIRRSSKPAQAASLGRDRTTSIRRDWESVKVDVMRKAVAAKFEQHPDLAALLLSTDDSLIVEHTENDAFWGDGGDGSGKNMLGRILVEVRTRLRSAG